MVLKILHNEMYKHLKGLHNTVNFQINNTYVTKSCVDKITIQIHGRSIDFYVIEYAVSWTWLQSPHCKQCKKNLLLVECLFTIKNNIHNYQERLLKYLSLLQLHIVCSEFS